MIFHHFDISSIPLYNTDEESKQDPEPVKIFKQAIRDSNALLIATPEYNYGTSRRSKKRHRLGVQTSWKIFTRRKTSRHHGSQHGNGRNHSCSAYRFVKRLFLQKFMSCSNRKYSLLKLTKSSMPMVSCYTIPPVNSWLSFSLHFWNGSLGFHPEPEQLTSILK